MGRVNAEIAQIKQTAENRQRAPMMEALSKTYVIDITAEFFRRHIIICVNYITVKVQSFLPGL